MFAEPTIDDFSDNIRWHLKKAADRGGVAVAEVMARLAKAGALQSGRAVLLIFDAVRKEFDAGIETALGELKRSARITKLDPRELRQVTMTFLDQFMVEMKSITRSEQYRSLVKQVIDEKLAEFDRHLAFAVRQFDVGFFNPTEPEVPSASNNSINIGAMHGSAIQQGSHHGVLVNQFKLNADEARTALGALEVALKAITISEEQRVDMSAEIATIRAQLSKTSPSVAIIQQAGHSLRNIVEGMAAGLMTPTIIATAPALWSALGLG